MTKLASHIRRIPILTTQTFCGSGIPDDWQRWAIKTFRDVRILPGISEKERLVGVPVTGDSLREEAILHGDILIVRITLEYVHGKIGIWETPHGRTAKFASENFDGTVTLHNKHDWEQVWQPDEIKLMGMLVKVERDYE